MNIERLQAVRDAILNPPEGYAFNMVEWIAPTNCGTAACIAGFACLQDPRPRKIWEVELDAQRLLGLTRGQAWSLFAPGSINNYATITPAQAAATIDHLIATGEVVWAAP